MAGDNLTVTIGADTSKLRGELKLAREQLKALGRDVSGAVKRGDVALADSLSKQYGTLESRVVGLNRSLKGTAGALDQVTAAGGRMRLQFRNLGGSLETIAGQLGRLGGGLFGGLIGGAVISGIREVTKALDDQIERITKIRDLARDTARTPASVAASQAVGRATGETEDVITKALQTQAANFAELERRRIGTVPSQSREAQAKRDELIQQRARLLGGGPIAQRGGGEEAAAIDLSKIYEILVVDVARFKGNAEAAANFIDKSFLQIAKSGRLTETQLNEVSKALYGISAPAAIKLATANIEKYNAELAKTKAATDKAVSEAERLAAAQGKLENQYNESTAGITSAYTQLKTAIAEGTTQILKEGVEGTLKREGERRVQDLQNQKDAEVLIFNTIADAAVAAGQKIKEAFTSFGAGGGAFGDPSTPAMPITPIEQEFDKLPPYFQGITDTIGKLWNGLWGSLISGAQAAEMSTAKSAQAMSRSFAQAAAAAMGAANAVQGALAMAQGAAQLAAAASGGAGGGGAGGGAGGTGPSVFRGGTGFPSPYGPPGGSGYGPRGSEFGETASPARGGDPREGGTSTYLQSYAPGMSNYQALPPHRVDPIDYSAAMGWAGGGMIHGPGSGTSDSILARVSNGEFVMRAAAVRNLGAGFLSTLNRFAGGGMVMPSRGIPSFANGGLVTAGAGTGRAVHLHLGGHEFALSGPGGVVDALVTEASRQRMRSGGLKPSWYGGRVSG